MTYAGQRLFTLCGRARYGRLSGAVLVGWGQDWGHGSRSGSCVFIGYNALRQ